MAKFWQCLMDIVAILLGGPRPCRACAAMTGYLEFNDGRRVATRTLQASPGPTVRRAPDEPYYRVSR